MGTLRLIHSQPGNTDSPGGGPGAQCPPDVGDDVRDIWNYTVAQLGTVNPADRDALLVYCQAVAAHRKASDMLTRSPVLVPGAAKGTVTQNPAVRVQRDAAGIIRAFAAEFGLTPAARIDPGHRPATIPHLREADQ